MPVPVTSAFEKLSAAAHKKGFEITLPFQGKHLRIQLNKAKKVIDYELVKDKESVEDAAKRIMTRLMKDNVI